VKVLVACEESQAVCIAFRKKGHEAFSCDTQNCSGGHPEWHIKDDVLNHLHDGWDLMVAHPPCKYICNGGNNWLNRRPDLAWRENRELSAQFFLRFIEAPINKIAVENPIGCMNSKYRKPDQIIHPYMFGHDIRKDTCFWLKNLPPLMPTLHIPPPHRKIDYWSNKRNPGGRSLKSVTYQGIADAMSEQWG
tara:strand:- start:3899 stop:4471 length:573 start_codon:yes stop_codon:yes gene_type:complete